MVVRELIALLKEQDPDMEVVGSDEVVFELSQVGVHEVYTGEKEPASEPNVSVMVTKPCVVIS